MKKQNRIIRILRLSIEYFKHLFFSFKSTVFNRFLRHGFTIHSALKNRLNTVLLKEKNKCLKYSMLSHKNQIILFCYFNEDIKLYLKHTQSIRVIQVSLLILIFY